MNVSTRPAMVPVVPPLLIDDVFTDAENDALFTVLREHGPWQVLLGQYFQSVEELLAVVGPDRAGTGSIEDYLIPNFRGFFGRSGVALHDEAHDVFFSRRLLDMVKQMHGARYGAPYLFQFNVTAPTDRGGRAHFDGRSWRGMDPTNTPAWLMGVMARSGLFDRWEVKAGQVISYYYRSDVDGGFVYWPEGHDQPARRIAAPWWNNGFVTDNQHMFHRGEPSGPRDRRERPAGLSLASTIEMDQDGWTVRDGGRELAHYGADEVRILFHYSAHVFADLGELSVFNDHVDDLDASRALDMLADAAGQRGIAVDVPSDWRHDQELISALDRAFPLAPTTEWAPQ